MSKQKKTDTTNEITDEELDAASAGATSFGDGVSLTSDLGKDGVLIQNIGFPDDSGGSKLGDKSDVLLNPSRTYKKI